MDKPTEKPSETRPPTSSHSSPSTSTPTNSCGNQARDLDKRAGLCPVTSYTATQDPPIYQTIEKVCNGKKWPQACWHYSSAISVANNPRLNPVTCSEWVPSRNFIQDTPAIRQWSLEHNAQWKNWLGREGSKCDRDEWPPTHFWQEDPGQLIRLIPDSDNSGVAASLWRSFCPEHASFRCVPGTERIQNPPAGKRGAVTTFCEKELTLKVMSMSFEMEDVPLAQYADDGLSANECWPSILVDDPSYALLNTDPYFARNGRAPNAALWAAAPSPNLIGNKSPPFGKRDLDPSEFLVDTGNSSRRLTPGELKNLADNIMLQEHEDALDMLNEQMENLGYVDCVGENCATQLTPMMRVKTPTAYPTMTAPVLVDATATAVTSSLDSLPTQGSVAFSRSGPIIPAGPAVTAAVQHDGLKFLRNE